MNRRAPWARVLALLPALCAVPRPAAATPPTPTPTAQAARAAPTLGLPPLPGPLARLQTPARVALGRKPFFDRRLSFNGTQSCAMCHQPEQGFTTHTSRTSVGIEGKSLRRNAPTLLNVAWQRTLFHDGRESSLVTQAWLPLLHPDEMGNVSIGQVLDRLAALPDYAAPLRAAGEPARPTMATVGEALAAFQATLVAGGSRFDAWRYGGQGHALSALERQGWALFSGRAGCSGCHAVGARAALFTDHRFHDTGVARAWQPGTLSVQLAPGLATTLAPGARAGLIEPQPTDLGRYEVSLDPADRHAFRTPSLRNVELTAPYMHDGSLPTLQAVIEHYDQGGGGARGERPLPLRPLALSADEKLALQAFLLSLTARPQPGGATLPSVRTAASGPR